MSVRLQKASAIDRLTEYNVGALLLTWFGMCLLFAVIYTLIGHFNPSHSLNLFIEEELHVIDRMLHSLYFSFTTAATIGYGDVAPIGFSKGIAAIQVIASVILFAVIVAKLFILRSTNGVRRF